MTLVTRLAAVYFLALGAAALHYGVVRGGGRRVPAFVGLAGATLLLPLIAPADQRVLRFVCAVHCLAMAAKMYDLGEPRTRLPEPRDVLRWLLNPTSFVLRKLAAEPSPPRRETALRLARGSVQTAVGAALVIAVWRSPVARAPFFVEHVVKVLAFYVVVLGSLDVMVSAIRLAGDKARDPMGSIFTASTPAEFWRRYNRTVGQFFWEDLFPRFGGMRRPVRATLLVFGFSSLIHEYVFGIAIGAVQGWQTAFFMAQGVAVAATLRVRPKRTVATAATLAFNAASSVLFFASVNQLTPFWAPR